jgi:cytochrome c
MGIRRFRFFAAGLAMTLPLMAAAHLPAEEPTAEALLKEKCSLCHSSKRINRMDPVKIKETVERMRKMNPDWISSIQSDHIAAVIAKTIDDPNIIASRTAWREALDRGAALFKDDTLGKKGVSCSICHTKPEQFAKIEDTYPRWDAKLKRFVGLDETIALMLREKIGAELAPNDQRIHDLLIYLKTL